MQTLCCLRAGAPTSSVSVATSEQEPKCFHGSPRTSEASSPSWAATRCRREIPPMMMTRTKKTKRTRTGTKNRRSSENPTNSAAHRPVATRERVPLQEDCSGSGALKDGHTWEPKPSALQLPAFRSRRPGAHLQLNVHTPMGMGNKFLNTARSRSGDHEIFEARPCPLVFPELRRTGHFHLNGQERSDTGSTGASGLKTGLREGRAAVARLGAGSLSRRKLLLQRQKRQLRRRQLTRTSPMHVLKGGMACARKC
jgi:hypothetical protein